MKSNIKLIFTLNAIALAFSAAYAQDTTEKEKEVEVISVVGSRIFGADTTGALPVTVISSTEIAATGASSGEDLFRSIPQMGNVSFNQTSGQVSSNFARGDVGSVDLRGLGVGNTLVLINGRRGVNYPSSQANDNLAPVLTFNSNTLPVNGISRVEVLRDGAGALYGSDAVAGVVNTVLVDDYEGAQFEIQYGDALGTHQQELTINSLLGTDFADGMGNVTLFVNYQDRSALEAGDQAFTATSDLRPFFAGTLWEGNTALRNDSTTSPWGSFQTRGNVRVRQNGTSLTSAAGAFHLQPSTNTGCLANVSTGVCLDDAAPAFTGDDQNLRWDARTVWPISVMPDLQRLNLFSTGKYELKNGMELFGELGYYAADTESTQDSVFSIASMRMTIPASNYWNPFGPVTFSNGSANPNRLSGIDAPVGGLPVSLLSYRFNDLGPSLVRVEARQYRGLAGIKGEVAEWHWESALLYSEATVDDRQIGVSAQALQTSLALSTSQAFNPFMGGNSQEVLDSITFDSLRRAKTTLAQWDANISRADLFSTWAGNVGVSAGMEFRRETQLDDRDPNVDGTVTWTDSVTGVVNGSNLYGVSPTPDNDGSRNVTSLYAELAVPLVSTDMNVPLVQSFEIQLAGRYEDYSDFGSVAKPKIAFAWDMNDSLRLRGAYSEGFRAPNLEQVNATLVTRGNTRVDYVLCEADLRAGRITSFNGCSANVVATARRAGNPELEPEESTNKTIGAVYQPQWLPDDFGDVTLTTDYWTIEQTGIVGVFGEGNALIVDYLNRVQGTSNPNVIRLAPTADDIARFAGTGLEPVGLVQYVDDVYQNLQPQTVSGVDFGVHWRIDTQSAGDFNINLNASRLLQYDRGVADSITALYDARAAGTINIGTVLPEASDLIEQNGNPKLRFSASLTWTYNQFRVGTNANYVGEVDDTSMSDTSGNNYRVADHTLVNMYGEYSFAESDIGNSSIRIGVRNLFDKEPPLADETFGYMGSLYSATPRYVYIKFKTEF